MPPGILPACRPGLFLLGLFIGMLAVRSAFAGGQEKPPPLDRRTICIRGVCFDAEIAVTEEERARGLMHRDSLGRERGMLFVFPAEGIHQFWMKNTRLPLDIIFIGGDHRIVSIAKRAEPCAKEPCAFYRPAGNAAYALEINGGLAESYGFAAGDLVEFR